MYVSFPRRNFFLRIVKEVRDFSIDTSRNKYILLQHGNILKIICFC